MYIGFKNIYKKRIPWICITWSSKLFSRFKFINSHQNNWKERDDYQKGINILTMLSVINDVVERRQVNTKVQ
jgi:hypothetical protein